MDLSIVEFERQGENYMTQTADINIKRTYLLGEDYDCIEKRANQVLKKYFGYPNLIAFNNLDRSVTFSSERLIPNRSTNRPRILLLFSNPHPYSVHQGMFLSPNIKGRENLFWPVMHDSGWLPISEEKRHPQELSQICLNVGYDGPFEFIFYCYYAFPTNYPEDISKIFGKTYFTQHIEPESMEEFLQIINERTVHAVVTFNKMIFNLVSKDQIDRSIGRLERGDLIQSEVNGIDRHISIFLTFPTGWRFHEQYRRLRKNSLDNIRSAICG